MRHKEGEGRKNPREPRQILQRREQQWDGVSGLSGRLNKERDEDGRVFTVTTSFNCDSSHCSIDQWFCILPYRIVIMRD
jgi:hypothetical protein